MNTLSDVIKNGGGTFNPDGSTHYKTDGYFIGGKDCTRIPLKSSTINTHKLTVKFIIDKFLNFDRLDGYDFAGFWVDDNILYVERVIYIKNKQHAINQGKRNKQIAIWDIANSECILLEDK